MRRLLSYNDVGRHDVVAALRPDVARVGVEVLGRAVGVAEVVAAVPRAGGAACDAGYFPTRDDVVVIIAAAGGQGPTAELIGEGQDELAIRSC